MVVFRLLEILFTWCYWDGQLPGSSGHVTGDCPEDCPAEVGGGWGGSTVLSSSRGPGLASGQPSPGQDAEPLQHAHTVSTRS